MVHDLLESPGHFLFGSEQVIDSVGTEEFLRLSPAIQEASMKMSADDFALVCWIVMDCLQLGPGSI